MRLTSELRKARWGGYKAVYGTRRVLMWLQICARHKARSSGYTSELRKARWGGYKAARGARRAYVATNLCAAQGTLM